MSKESEDNHPTEETTADDGKNAQLKKIGYVLLSNAFGSMNP